MRRSRHRSEATAGARPSLPLTIWPVKKLTGRLRADKSSLEPLARNTYRNFNVVKDSNANTIEMIQKRTMIFGSAHPLSSKWW